ncbi:MAG: molybdate ABC transporter substrate-binding protein, partial [Myxococcales bacterium]|nr:molybdate ABC transporter substrate-binding protein [Myxococcales bacterium]
AANFAGPMQAIAADFERDTGDTVHVTSGATGTLYAQIRAGAPFDVLLAADEATPRRLEADGLAVAGSRFPYAIGKLVLWSARPGYVDAAGLVLRKAPFQHLAIANPKLAPYGAAAIEALAALGVLDALRPKLVEGESIAQAHQFVATGNAELGFVALSQLVAAPPPRAADAGADGRDPGAAPRAPGSTWIVPAKLYTPLRQDAVLLRKGAGNPAARALMEFLRTRKAAKDVIRAYGYDLPSPS